MAASTTEGHTMPDNAGDQHEPVMDRLLAVWVFLVRHQAEPHAAASALEEIAAELRWGAKAGRP